MKLQHATFGIVLAIFGSAFAFGQVGPAYGAHVPQFVTTGQVVNASSLSMSTPPITLTMPGSAWMKVWFGGADLPNGSFVRVEGILDGFHQDLDVDAYEKWEGTSCYFNGDSVRVSLQLPPFSTGFVTISGVDAGFPSVVGIDSICGATDDRVPTAETRIGRLLNSGGSAICSGGLISANGVFMTAGHCIGGNQYTVEFNCPPSTVSGAVVHPSPINQYPADSASLAYTNGGIGNDWAAFRLFSNTTSGLSAPSVQGFYNRATSIPLIGSTTRISGFGTGAGVQNQAPTTHTGGLSLVSGTRLEYTVDTTGGNSGSCVVNEASQLVFGIHTNAGCTASGGANSGTSILNSGLQAHLATIIQVPGIHQVSVSQIGAAGNPITVAVTDAPPFSEVVNALSFVTTQPLGTGPFFGLGAGAGSGDLFFPFTLPVGVAPFHVMVDGSGDFSVTIPSAGSFGTFTFDIVSIAFNPSIGYAGYLGRSAVVRATIVL